MTYTQVNLFPSALMRFDVMLVVVFLLAAVIYLVMRYTDLPEEHIWFKVGEGDERLA